MCEVDAVFGGEFESVVEGRSTKHEEKARICVGTGFVKYGILYGGWIKESRGTKVKTTLHCKRR